MTLPSYPGDLSAFTELLQLSTLTLATVGLDGLPHTAPVYFVAVGNDLPESRNALQLDFFSDPASQHAQDLAHRPEASVAIYPEGNTWQDIRGLQMQGTVQIVPPGVQWELAWAKYQDKFRYASAFGEVVKVNTLFAFQPRWIRMLDNRRGFGFKEEWTLP